MQLSLCGTTVLSEGVRGHIMIRLGWESGCCHWILPAVTGRGRGASLRRLSMIKVGWTDVVESQDIWAGEHRYLQVPLPDFTREEMLAQETSKPAECHIASKWQSQSLNQRLLNSCSGSHASGPAGCRAGCPAVSKWCFLSWSLGS